jgi:hypothetical protein
VREPPTHTFRECRFLRFLSGIFPFRRISSEAPSETKALRAFDCFSIAPDDAAGDQAVVGKAGALLNATGCVRPFFSIAVFLDCRRLLLPLHGDAEVHAYRRNGHFSGPPANSGCAALRAINLSFLPPSRRIGIAAFSSCGLSEAEFPASVRESLFDKPRPGRKRSVCGPNARWAHDWSAIIGWVEVGASMNIYRMTSIDANPPMQMIDAPRCTARGIADSPMMQHRSGKPGARPQIGEAAISAKNLSSLKWPPENHSITCRFATWLLAFDIEILLRASTRQLSQETPVYTGIKWHLLKWSLNAGMEK